MALNNKKFTKNKSEQDVDWIGWAVFIAVVLISATVLTAQIAGFTQEARDLDAQQAGSEKMLSAQIESKTPHEVYGQLRQALLANDLEGALDTIHPAYRYKYEDGLKKAKEEGRLQEAAERLTPLAEKVYDDEWSTVRYEIEPLLQNNDPNPIKNYTRSVEFTLTSKGYWKISSI